MQAFENVNRDFACRHHNPRITDEDPLTSGLGRRVQHGSERIGGREAVGKSGEVMCATSSD
jgi:hypothetical protein